MTRYRKGMIERICKEAIGQTIECMEYCEEDDYFTITFTSGSEFSFRFMADLTKGGGK